MASNFANQTYDLCDNPNPSPLLKRREEPRCQTESFHMNRISNLAPGQWLSRRISNIYANPDPPDPSGATGNLNEKRKEELRGQTESFHINRVSNIAPRPWLSRRISNIYAKPDPLDPSGVTDDQNEKSTICYKIAIVILAILLLLSSTLAALFALRKISLPALFGSKCLTDADCNIEMTCTDNSCVNTTCPKPCGKNAWCQAKDHTSVCRCHEGYIGNPYSGCGTVTVTSIQHKQCLLILLYFPFISQVIARATKIVEMMKHVKKHFVKSVPWLYQDAQLTLTATPT